MIHSMQQRSLRVAFLTQADPLYVLPFFNELFRSYANDFQTVGVYSCRTMGSRSRLQLAIELLALYRPVGMARLLSRYAGHKALGVLPLGRTKAFSLPQLCRMYRVTLQTIRNPNDEAFVQEIRNHETDLIVSVACPYILRANILAAPALGCINIHHAPLPSYKGMMPTFWQMFHGEATVGLTIHSMSAKVDEGEVLDRATLAIKPRETLDELIRRSKEQGAHSMGKLLRRFAEGQPPLPLAPLQVQPSYFTFPTLEEIKQFHRRKLRPI